MEYIIASEQPVPHMKPRQRPRIAAGPNALMATSFPFPRRLHGHRKAVFGAGDGVVERIPLYGDSAGLGDEAAEILAGHALRRGGAGVVIDLLLDDGAVQVIGAKAKRNLRNLWREHLPIGLDVGEVVEQLAADGDLANVGQARSDRQMVERRVWTTAP